MLLPLPGAVKRYQIEIAFSSSVSSSFYSCFSVWLLAARELFHENLEKKLRRAYVVSRFLSYLWQDLITHLAKICIPRKTHLSGFRAENLPDGKRVDQTVNICSTCIDVIALDLFWSQAFFDPCRVSRSIISPLTLSPLPGTVQRYWSGETLSFYIVRLSNRFASFAIEFRPTILGKLKLTAIFYQ